MGVRSHDPIFGCRMLRFYDLNASLDAELYYRIQIAEDKSLWAIKWYCETDMSKAVLCTCLKQAILVLTMQVCVVVTCLDH